MMMREEHERQPKTTATQWKGDTKKTKHTERETESQGVKEARKRMSDWG
jgi:hypothetical protein